jgi:hypothetical protein
MLQIAKEKSEIIREVITEKQRRRRDYDTEGSAEKERRQKSAYLYWGL